MLARHPLLSVSPALRLRNVAMRYETPADLAFARVMYGETRADELALLPWTAEMRERFLDSQFALQSAHFDAQPDLDRFVITRRGRRIGRLYLNLSRQWWRVAEIMIAPPERGRGIGTAICGWLEDVAALQGAAGLELQVARHNMRAQALYFRLGFKAGAGETASHRLLRRTISRSKCGGPAQLNSA